MAGEAVKTAIFWDESYIWGLIAYRTFRRLGIGFDILTSYDVRNGRLASYDLLFVPGGWASDKIKALGSEGAQAIRDYVSGGGSYFGACGGAGLALSHENGLGLAPFGRMPAGSRLPSLSGKIALMLPDRSRSHPMWRGIKSGSAFYAWWPGQFNTAEARQITVLASYGEPQPGSFVTDLPVLPDFDWDSWEKLYGINLNPARIMDEPAVVELGYGAGKVLLSYLHFETPEDETGHQVLKNVIGYLAGKPVAGRQLSNLETRQPVPKKVSNSETLQPVPGRFNSSEAHKPVPGRFNKADAAAAPVAGLMNECRRFIDFGVENFLWYRRSEWLLNWRRGIRGIEYSTVYAMLFELNRLSQLFSLDDGQLSELTEAGQLLSRFFALARRLLVRERYAMCRGPISPLKTGDEVISSLRRELFSNDKRWGGLFEEIIKRLDGLLLPLLINEISLR